MRKNVLGNTGIEVTELTLGALTMGPLQANLPFEEAKKLILAALNKGINCIDTAEMYQVDEPIKAALSEFEGEAIIATKSTARTYEEMNKSVLGALQGLGRDHIDIFYLHAANVSPAVFEERSGAFQCLLDYKKKGYIRSVGIATHVVQVVEKAAEIREIDVVFPLINKAGLGVVGGTVQDMERAISKASRAGKGLFAMKSLGGGNLIGNLKEAFEYVRSIPGISSVAVGMLSIQELEVNIKLFNGEEVPVEILKGLKAGKQLFISRICTGCGTCVKTCPNNALFLKNGKAHVDKTRCILCGYCNPVCPEFALRLV